MHNISSNQYPQYPGEWNYIAYNLRESFAKRVKHRSPKTTAQIFLLFCHGIAQEEWIKSSTPIQCSKSTIYTVYIVYICNIQPLALWWWISDDICGFSVVCGMSPWGIKNEKSWQKPLLPSGLCGIIREWRTVQQWIKKKKKNKKKNEEKCFHVNS